MINKAICCQCVLWLKSKIAKISTLKVKRIAKSLKFDPVNNSSLKVIELAHLECSFSTCDCHICIYMCVFCTYACVCLYSHMFVHRYMCVICMYVCFCAFCMHVCMFARMCLYACVYVCMYICMFMCVCCKGLPDINCSNIHSSPNLWVWFAPLLLTSMRTLHSLSSLFVQHPLQTSTPRTARLCSCSHT